MKNKIIRTICCFTKNPTEQTKDRLDYLSSKLLDKGFEVQTRRICSPKINDILKLDKIYANDIYIFGIGEIEIQQIESQWDNLLATKDTSFNLDLTNEEITEKDVQLLFKIIKENPSKTFNFAYTFNNPPSSPFFPSGYYSQEGFSIGLQPTDLSEECKTLEDWFNRMGQTWEEINLIYKKEIDYLGIDSSAAPLFTGKSSIIGLIKKLGYDFERSTTTDIYTKITDFIKTNNPKPVGLCGLMLPCLEDFELAEEYEKGNFPIERNLFLSLQSGLGIDTYPIGTDQNPKRVLDVLRLVQRLSNKHNKPLSIRFVSDGKTRIGQRTDFNNQYLEDVVVREL